MKSAIVLASMIALLVFAGPASATIILDFGTGDTGNAGTITSTGLHTGSGSGIGIDTLTRSDTGDIYDVDGTVRGSNVMEGLVGSLDYNTTTNTFTITGSIVCDETNTGTTGACAGKSAGFVLVPSTILLLGTGTLSLTNDTSIAGQDQVSFAAGTDDKAATLLAALGIPCSADPLHPGYCTGWTYHGFSIGANNGTGNTYTAFSTDVPDTFTPSGIPEPTSIVLLGTVLVGVTQLIRRRTSKA